MDGRLLCAHMCTVCTVHTGTKKLGYATRGVRDATVTRSAWRQSYSWGRWGRSGR